MIVEARSRVAYFVAREVLERVVPPTKLKLRPGATLESAKELDSKQRDSRESANHFYTVFKLDPKQADRAEAVVGLSQELINLGRFRQARKFLDRMPSSGLNDADLFYFMARVHEKLAWIADYEIGYQEALRELILSRRIVNSVPKLGEREEDLLSTLEHFSGREYLGLAKQYTDSSYLTCAKECFNKDLQRYQRLRDEGRPRPAGEGYNHAWLGRMHMLMDNQELADSEIEETADFFEEETQKNPKSGIMAHYHVLKGHFTLKYDPNRLDLAEHHFDEANRIRRDVEHYPKGLADAHAGLAMTYWRMHRPQQATSHAVSAIRAHPYILLHSVAGG